MKPTDNHPAKTKSILALCAEADIVALQETHISNESVEYIKAITAGRRITMTTGPSNRSGVALLVNRPSITILESHSSSHRDLWVKLKDKNRLFSILIVYAPAEEKERRDYFTNQLHALIAERKPDIVCGDFNCVLRKEDNIGFKSLGNKGAPALRTALAIGGLVDAALVDEDALPGHTFIKHKNGEIHSRRIDMIFINKTTTAATESYVINHLGLSDHMIVAAKLNVGNTVEHGPGIKRIWPQDVRAPDTKHKIHALAQATAQCQTASAELRMRAFRVYSVQLVRSARRRGPPLSAWTNAVHLLTQLEKRTPRDSPMMETVIQPLRDHANTLLCSETQRVSTLTGYRRDTIMETPSKLLTAILDSRKKEVTFNSVKVGSTSFNETHDMLRVIREHYSNLYSSHGHDRKKLKKLLLEWDVPDKSKWTTFSLPFAAAEISAARRLLSESKAGGLDDIGLAALNDNPNLDHTITEMANDWWVHGGPAPYEWKRAVLIPLYKGRGGLDNLNARRTISLLDTVYKIVAKALVIRLLPILTSIIGPEQNGFLQGRTIIDNLMAFNEAIDAAQEAEGTPIIDLADVEKAFDEASRAALYRILRHLGCPEASVRAIERLFTGNIAYVLVNGFLTKSFAVNSGVRQGCPLGPYLFLLIIELLATLIRKHPLLRGIQLCREALIRLVLTADDTITFARNAQEELIIRRLIMQWSRAVGLTINKDKCVTIAPHGSPLDVPNDWPELNDGDETRVLGWFTSKTGVVSKFKSMKEDFIADLKRWRGIYSQPHARATIANTYATSKLLYKLRAEVLDDEQVQEIDDLLHQYVRHRTVGKPITMPTFIRLCQPKKLGGLGLKSFRATYLAQKADLAARALKGNQPWHIAWRERISDRRAILNLPEDISLWEEAQLQWHEHRLMSECLRCYRMVMRERPIPLDTFSTREAYKALIIEDRPVLSSEMRNLEGQGVNWTKVWERIHRLPIPPHVRTFLWRWNTRTMSMPHTNQMARCLAPGCHHTNGHLHTILECESVARKAQILASTIAEELGIVDDHSEMDWDLVPAVSLGADDATVQESCLRAVTLWSTWNTIYSYKHKKIHNIAYGSIRVLILRMFARCAELHVRDTQPGARYNYDGWSIDDVLVGRGTHLELLPQHQDHYNLPLLDDDDDDFG
jgi:exonuclease III